MSIYLGTHGKVELRREFDGNNLVSTVNVSDVNATRKRLSFDLKTHRISSVFVTIAEISKRERYVRG